MNKIRISAFLIIILAVLTGYFVFSTEVDPQSKYHFKYGLDLSSGTHLVYKADTSALENGDTRDAMSALREVIERRVNVFGVSEPIVQVEQGGFGGEKEERLIVELPGITDVQQAVELIGRTPLLEFKLANQSGEITLDENGNEIPGSSFVDTGLTGRYLKRAQLTFGGSQGVGINEPIVLIEFNKEGADLFAEITKAHVGEILAIFLDGEPLSLPVIQTEITGGSAQITGDFTPDEAKTLVRDLNLGALPVPIELISTQSIGASLGHDALTAGVKAGLIGLLLLSLFLIFWYRLPGLIAVFSLGTYLVITLLLFKTLPVVLTAAGIAGFILSIGMAVDANVLIFERIKDELEHRDDLQEAIKLGFSRAWLSIRDGNISSIITSIILFWFGTSLVKGFALTFGLGVLISMISAISVSRTFILAVSGEKYEGARKFLFGHGIH